MPATVVISQHQGKNPAKRQLEEELATALSSDENVQVALVPHLYDLSANHSAMELLRSITGDLIVLSWLYPRGSRWILDRQNVRGHEGLSLLESKAGEDDDDEEDVPESSPSNSEVTQLRNGIPDRRIYCIDLRDHDDEGDGAPRRAPDCAKQLVLAVGHRVGRPANPNKG